MKEQSAVDFLHSKILFNIGLDDNDIFKLRELVKIAKKLEKQQIIDGFGVGCHHESKRLVGYQDVAKQYYNETYGSKGSDETKTDKI